MHTDRQPDRQPDRQTDRQTDRPTDKEHRDRTMGEDDGQNREPEYCTQCVLQTCVMFSRCHPQQPNDL